MPSRRMEGRNAGLPLTWYPRSTINISVSNCEISCDIDGEISCLKAGCGDLSGSDGNVPGQTDDGEEGGTGDDSEARTTVLIDVQEEIQAAQEEIGTRVQEGNLSQEDAQAELRDTQSEIISAAVEDVRTYVADIDGLTVENANEQAGAVLVAGPAAAVLGTLDADSVKALLSATDFPAPQEDGQPNGS